MERTCYYFRHNSIILQHAPVLILLLCAFWTGYDLFTGDSMYFVATGAIGGIAAMSFCSVLALIGFEKVKKGLGTEETETPALLKTMRITLDLYLLLFVVMAVASACILGANNYAIAVTGAENTKQTVALASTLLLIPAIIPFPTKRLGIVFIAFMYLSLGIPFLMPGSECYSFLPELVLRAALDVAYQVIAVRSNRDFLLEKRMRDGNTKLLEMMVGLIELRDTGSGRHVSAVRGYTKVLLEKIASEYPEYGLTPDTVRVVSEASAAHDIGKLMIPDGILLKPGRLTDEEFEIMKTHTEKGCEILRRMPAEILGDDYIRYSMDICRCHHEKYDGKGYPAGLKGEEIPIWAQAVSVVDCYEALTSERPYKKAFSHDTAVDMIQRGECGAFSPRVLACFAECEEAFRRMTEADEASIGDEIRD